MLFETVTVASEDRCSQQMQSLSKPKIYSENSFIVDEQLAEDECLCEVCCDLIDSSSSARDIDELTTMSCRHTVCLRCWKLHLTTKLQQQHQQEDLLKLQVGVYILLCMDYKDTM